MIKLPKILNQKNIEYLILAILIVGFLFLSGFLNSTILPDTDSSSYVVFDNGTIVKQDHSFINGTVSDGGSLTTYGWINIGAYGSNDRTYEDTLVGTWLDENFTREFDVKPSSSERYVVLNGSTLQTGNHTWETWVYDSGGSRDYTYFRCGDEASYDPTAITMIGMNINSIPDNYAYYDGSWQDSGVAYSVGWHNFKIYRNSTHFIYYIDGVQIGTDSSPSGQALYCGLASRNNANNRMAGTLAYNGNVRPFIELVEETTSTSGGSASGGSLVTDTLEEDETTTKTSWLHDPITKTRNFLWLVVHTIRDIILGSIQQWS